MEERSLLQVNAVMTLCWSPGIAGDCEVSGSKRHATRHSSSLCMTGSQGCEG